MSYSYHRQGHSYPELKSSVMDDGDRKLPVVPIVPRCSHVVLFVTLAVVLSSKHDFVSAVGNQVNQYGCFHTPATVALLVDVPTGTACTIAFSTSLEVSCRRNV